MNRKLMLAAAFAAITTVQPALADSMNVRVGDLDLATPEGRTKLDLRVHIAAQAVCRPSSDHDLAALAESRRCYRIAVASVQTQVATLVARKARRA